MDSVFALVGHSRRQIRPSDLSSDKNYTADYKVYPAHHCIFGSMSHALRWLRLRQRFRRISRRQASQLPRRCDIPAASPLKRRCRFLLGSPSDSPMIAVLQAKAAGLWTRAHVRNNAVAGVIVSVVALPLAMASAIASG